jgi:hypothetical protein
MLAAVAGLLLLTLVLRIAVVVVDGDRLHSDPDAYVRLATMLADGQGYSTADGSHPTAFRPVLYPLMLAVPMKLGMAASTVITLWNLVSGIVLVLATIGLAQACGLRRKACLVAGLLVAADPLLIRYTTEPMTENICAALLTLSLLFMVRFASATNHGDTTNAFKMGLAAGLLLGLSALCRPVVLVSCVLLTLVLVFVFRQNAQRSATEPTSAWRRIAWAFLPALIAAMTVSPWIIRNAVEFKALVPATTHGGYTLLLGNNSEFYGRVVSGQERAWDGESLNRWQQGLEQQLTAMGIDRADERAVDQWMYEHAIAEIRSQPVMAVRAVLLRWKRFWAISPTASGTSLPRYFVIAVGAWYACIGIGLLASLLRLRRNTSIPLLWVNVVSFLMVHSFYWTNTRMRAPLTGVLIVLAVIGWSLLTRQATDADSAALNEKHPD